MDIKGGNGLMFGYIQERPWGPHYLVDIFGKLYKGRLAELLHWPNNDGIIRMPYLHRGLQFLSFNLGYNRENIDQDQCISGSDTTMEPRFSYVFGNSNKDIWKLDELNVSSNQDQWRAENLI